MKYLKAIINEHPFFHGMKPEHLELAAQAAREVKFAAGDVIFREGECAADFFLLETGRVVLDAHAPGREAVVIQTLGPGDVLGWSWLFPPFVWHFGARAIAPTTAICFNGARLLIACEENSALGYDLMKRVARVMMQRLQATRLQLLDVYGTRP